MKLLHTILFTFLFLPLAFSQQTIYANWYYDLVDTTIVDPVEARYHLPQQLINISKKDIVFATFNFNSGWSVRRLDKKTGKPVWENYRNADYPNKPNKLYTFDNIFLRPDGNLDVLGVVGKGRPYGPIGDGDPVRVIYDSNTGAEKKFIQVAQPSNDTFSILKPGIIGAFAPKHNKPGYFMLNYERFGKRCLSIQGVDSNLLILDTLGYYYECKNSINPFLRVNASTGLSKIGSNYYAVMSVTDAAAEDTLRAPKYLYKIDSEGKQVSTKNVSKALFSSIRNIQIAPTSDGYLFSGMVDTAIKFKNYVTPMVARIDTNGNKLWHVFLKPPPGIDSLNQLSICEDKVRKGHWAIYLSLNRSNYLYFIDSVGKARLVCKLKLPSENKEPANTYLSWVLSDGNLYFNYRYVKSIIFSTQVLKTMGLSMVESSVLDNLLNTVDSKEVIPLREVMLFPNPTSGQLHLSFDKEFSGVVQVLNQLGQWIKTEVVENAITYDLDTGDLTDGIYFMQLLEKGNQVAVKKFVVLR